MRPNPTVCFMHDCPNLTYATPVLEVWAKGYPPGSHPPAELRPMIGFCKAHATREALDVFAGPEAWAQITAIFEQNGMKEPDRDTLDLHWAVTPLVN